MKTFRRVAPALAVVLVTGAAATGCKFDGAYDLPLPGSPVDEDHSFEVSAEFRDVLNLVPRSPVMVNDVTVGEVTDVSRSGWHAVVTMRVQDDTDLPANVIADIRQTSLLGEKYVALVPDPEEEPTGKLADGDSIALSDTGRNPEVEEVLGALSFLLNGGGVAQLKTISTELNKVMEGRQEDLGHLLGELDTAVGSLDDQKGDIIAAMEAIDGLTRTLNKEHDTVVAAIDTLGPAVRVLADQRQALMTMLRSLDRLGVVGTRVITASKDDTLAILRHLRPVLTKLNQAGQALPKSLELLVSFPFPKEASKIVYGDYANTAIAMDLSLENIFDLLEDQSGGELPDLPEIPDIPELPLPDLPKGPDVSNPKKPKLPKPPKIELPGGLGDLLGLGKQADPKADSGATTSGGLLGGGLG